MRRTSRGSVWITEVWINRHPVDLSVWGDDMGTQGTGRKRSTKKDKTTAEDDALNLIAREVSEGETINLYWGGLEAVM